MQGRAEMSIVFFTFWPPLAAVGAVPRVCTLSRSPSMIESGGLEMMRSCPVSPVVISAIFTEVASERDRYNGRRIVALRTDYSQSFADETSRALTGTVNVGTPSFIFRCTSV